MLIYDDNDDTIPCVTLPIDMKLHCQHSNLNDHRMTARKSTNSLFIESKTNFDEEIFSDVFDSNYILQTHDIKSAQSKSFTPSHNSLFNI